WRLEVTGLVRTPMLLSLADLRARPRKEVTFTVECSGNTGLPFFTGGVGNRPRAGTPPPPPPRAAGALPPGRGGGFRGGGPGDREGARRRGHRAVRPLDGARGRARPEQPARLRAQRPAAAAVERLPAAADRAGLVRGRQRQVAAPDRGPPGPVRGPLHGPGLR